MILSLKETAIKTQDESCSKGNNQLTHQQMSVGAVFKVGGSGKCSFGQQNKQMATKQTNGNKANKWKQTEN